MLRDGVVRVQATAIPRMEQVNNWNRPRLSEVNNILGGLTWQVCTLESPPIVAQIRRLSRG